MRDLMARPEGFEPPTYSSEVRLPPRSSVRFVRTNRILASIPSTEICRFGGMERGTPVGRIPVQRIGQSSSARTRRRTVRSPGLSLYRGRARV